MAGVADAAGFVLVGGQSSRMGSDKALKTFRGTPLASRIAGQLANIAGQVSLVGDPRRYGHLGYPVVPDEFPGRGPVGGVLTALHASRSTWNIITACDLPAVTSALFADMLGQIQSSSFECLVPVTPDGREQVLCAIYRRDAAAGIEAAWVSGKTRLREAVRQLRTYYWPVSSAGWAVNLNTPQDWASYLGQEA